MGYDIITSRSLSCCSQPSSPFYFGTAHWNGWKREERTHRLCRISTRNIRRHNGLLEQQLSASIVLRDVHSGVASGRETPSIPAHVNGSSSYPVEIWWKFYTVYKLDPVPKYIGMRIPTSHPKVAEDRLLHRQLPVTIIWYNCVSQPWHA